MSAEITSVHRARLSPLLAHRALDATVTGVTIVDMTNADQPITYVNPAFERMTGYAAADVLGRNCRFLQGPETDPVSVLALSASLAAGEECLLTLRNYRADGTSFWNELRLSPVRNDDGDVGQFIGIQNDVTDRRVAEERVEHLAFHDSLTGLANRHALRTALEGVTRSDEALALIFVDLDEFKLINDSLGHVAGDGLLMQVGRRLARVVRPGDLLARQGGDEFLILLNRLVPDAEADAVAGALARRLVECLRRPFEVAGTEVRIGASVGVSLFPRDASDGATLLRHADSAMYGAKAEGGNGWALYGGPVENLVPLRASTAAPSPADPDDGEALARLLGVGDLRAVYQPIVELDSGSVVGYEALIRGPVGSALERPAQLFAAARASGRLGELDWACRAAAVRGALASGIRSPLRLFVNAEPEALGVPCPERHREIWRRASELELVVEITERALTSRPADLLHSLVDFRARGWSIALDDVGADSRSLALMELLQPEMIKLDLRLVQERPSREVAEIVASVNAYCERTGASILGEGIETAEHLAAAHSFGAGYGQGWRFGYPGAPPSSAAPPAVSLPRTSRVVPAKRPTPFRAVARTRPVRRATKPLLLEMTWHLERQARALGETAILLAVFQTDDRFTPGTRRRYTRLAECLAFVAALGVGMEVEPAPGVRGGALDDDDPLKNEWSVVVLAPHFAGALVAVDLNDDGPDHQRRFDYAITYDRSLVIDSAGSLMQRIGPLT